MPEISGSVFIPFERVILFIDGAYLRKLFKDSFDDEEIDLWKMKNELLSLYAKTPANPFRPNLIRTYYYDGVAAEEPERSEHEKFFESLKRRFLFLTVRLGEAVKTSDGSLRQKGVDIRMAVDALTMAFRNHYDTGLFVLGDRDFIPLIRALKDAGKKTYLFCYIEKVPKELLWEFDFRLAFNEAMMEKWRYREKH